MDLSTVEVVRIAVGLAIMAYVGYCLANQKVWVRGDIGLQSTVFAWGTKEENELYGGSYPQASKDHHQDLYEHNLKYGEAEYHAQELLLQEEEYYGS